MEPTPLKKLRFLEIVNHFLLVYKVLSSLPWLMNNINGGFSPYFLADKTNDLVIADAMVRIIKRTICFFFCFFLKRKKEDAIMSWPFYRTSLSTYVNLDKPGGRDDFFPCIFSSFQSGLNQVFLIENIACHYLPASRRIPCSKFSAAFTNLWRKCLLKTDIQCRWPSNSKEIYNSLNCSAVRSRLRSEGFCSLIHTVACLFATLGIIS